MHLVTGLHRGRSRCKLADAPVLFHAQLQQVIQAVIKEPARTQSARLTSKLPVWLHCKTGLVPDTQALQAPTKSGSKLNTPSNQPPQSDLLSSSAKCPL